MDNKDFSWLRVCSIDNEVNGMWIFAWTETILKQNTDTEPAFETVIPEFYDAREALVSDQHSTKKGMCSFPEIRTMIYTYYQMSIVTADERNNQPEQSNVY